MSGQAITTSRRLVYNTLLNVATWVVNAAIAFFMIGFFIGRLGKNRYGVWLLIGDSIFRYAPLLQMGLNSAINWHIPVCLVKNNKEGIERVISTAFFFLMILASVVVAASALIYWNVGSWFVIEADLVRSAGILALIVGFCFAVAMPMQLSGGVLSGLQRYDIINFVILIALLVRTAVLVVLLSRGYGLLVMGVTFGICEIAMRAVQFTFARKILPGVSLGPGKVDFKLLREMLAYGTNTFLYTMGAVIIYSASNLVIGIFIGTEQISQFAVASAGVLLMSHLLEAFTGAIKPAVSDLDARNDTARVKEIAFLTQKYSLLLIIPATFFFVAMGGEFLRVWVGSKFPDAGAIDMMWTVLAILSVGHCLRVAQHSNFLVLVGLGEHRVFGVLTALAALICVSASTISVKVFNLGLVGIAWSNFLPMVLISGVVLPIYFNWKMRISAVESIRVVWLPALAGSLPAVAVIGVWKYVMPPASWVEIMAVVVVTTGVTAAGSWFLGLKAIERRRFAAILRSKR